MTRGELLDAWLAGASLADLRPQCTGDPEAALRAEFAQLADAIDGARGDALASYIALDAAATGISEMELDPYWRAYDLGRAAGLYAASLMIGHGIHTITSRGIR